jgi:hypothetical protein
VIASPVGAHSELIDDGRNGFIVAGHHESDQSRDQAASIILDLLRDPDRLDRVHRNVRAVIWDSDTMARVWTEDWDWRLGGIEPRAGRSLCSQCGGEGWMLADGLHCTACAAYTRTAPIAAA